MILRKLVGLALTLLAIMATALAADAWEREPLSVFQQRRARLIRDTGGDGLIVLYGYRDEDVAASVTQFRQNEEFYYLTGWNEPDAIMLLVPKRHTLDTAAELGKEILYIPPHDRAEEKWTGPKLGPNDADARERTGFAAVRDSAQFAGDFHESLKRFSKIYTELTPQPESGEEYFQADMVSKLREMSPQAPLADMRLTIGRMRAVKSAGEIDLIRKAVEASVDAHLAAMKAIRPGMWEYQVGALMKYEFERRGCEWPAYPAIVGSGFFSTILHYDEDANQLQDGDVVLMDVAGSYSGYASDITRTLPVNGHFTPRQREIYEIVRGAQNAALAAAKPGATIGARGTTGLNTVAFNYINTHGKDSHGQPLGPYFIHGVSHSIGLNVHDPLDYDRALEPGMVISMEPGIYLPEEKIGVRIEDDVLITPDGNEVLSHRLPRTVEEIEQLMGSREDHRQ
jgi:Xaa-Pro aminopeptidase